MSTRRKQPSYASAATAGGLTALGGKFTYDVNRVDDALEAAGRADKSLRIRFGNLVELGKNDFTFSPKAVDSAFDTYIDNMSAVARHRILGLRVGHGAQLKNVHHLSVKDWVKARFLNDWEAKDRLWNDGQWRHYEAFTDPGVDRQFLRWHMIEKAISNAANRGPRGAVDLRAVDSTIGNLGDPNDPIIRSQWFNLHDPVQTRRDLILPVKDRMGKDYIPFTELSDYFDQHVYSGKDQPVSRILADLDEMKASYGEGGSRRLQTNLLGRRVPDLYAADKIQYLEDIVKSIRGGWGPAPGVLSETGRIIGPGSGGFASLYDDVTKGFRRGVRARSLPLLVGGGLITALLAHKARKGRRKSAAAPSTFTKLKDIGDLTGIAGLSAMAAMNLNSRALRNLRHPNGELAVTYCTMTQDQSRYSDVGSGHKAPGEAIAELLERSIRQNPRKYKGLTPLVTRLIRDQRGYLDPNQFGRHFNSITDTGLGLNQQYWPDNPMDAMEHSHNMRQPHNITADSMNYMLTDPQPSYKLLGKNLDDMDVAAAYPRSESLGRAPNQRMFTWGPSRFSLSKGLREVFPGHVAISELPSSVTPAVGQDALDILSKPAKRSQVLGALSEMYSPTGVDEAFKQRFKMDDADLTRVNKQLRSIKLNDKLIVVSGSGRGDFVASRALDLMDEIGTLRKAGVIGDEIKVVAQMAGSYTDPVFRQMIDSNPNVIALPYMPKAEFTNLQRVADVHWGSSGASSFAEMMMQDTVQALPERWGFASYGGGGGWS